MRILYLHRAKPERATSIRRFRQRFQCGQYVPDNNRARMKYLFPDIPAKPRVLRIESGNGSQAMFGMGVFSLRQEQQE